MTRLRTIRQYGNGYIIALMAQDMKDLGLKTGDLVDIEDMVIQKPKKVKK
jgi:hypothetical protein